MVYEVFHIIDIILLILVSISGLYILIFSYASLTGNKLKFPEGKTKYRFAIIAANEFDISEQNYPQELYQIIHSNNIIETIKEIDENQYDGVIVLGEANRVSHNLLNYVNNAYYAGARAMQLHHITEGKITNKEYRKAYSEEIRNAILKKGHNQLNFSSAFDNVDYAINLKWLKKNLINTHSNLENRLLHQGIHIYYLPYANIYSTTARTRPKKFSKKKAFLNLLPILSEGNIDYFDKLIRCFCPTWKTLFWIVSTWCIISSIIKWTCSIKWWCILIIFLFTISAITPDYLVKDRKKKRRK